MTVCVCVCVCVRACVCGIHCQQKRVFSVCVHDLCIYSLDLNECAFLLLVNLFGKREPKTKQEPLKFAYNKCKVGKQKRHGYN